MNKIACFTGHRPSKLNGYKPEDNKQLLWELHNVIVDHIENKNVDTFISGMALGIDIWSAKIVLKLKETYPHIKLIAAVPCRNHSCKWREEDKKIWQEVIDKADKVVLVTDEEYKPYLMQVRNVWMVNNSEYVIAVWDKSEGGTKNCVDYANAQKKSITKINPKNYGSR